MDDTHRKDAVVRKSLKYSVLDGSAYAAMLGLSQNYFTPLALALKATTGQIGLLTSIPNLIMGISQLAAPDLSEKAGSRKGIILPMVFLHAVMFIPICLVPFIFPNSQVWWLIAFVTIGTVAGAIPNPVWGSLMADLVPIRVRGRYFAFRNRIAGIISLVFSFIAGAILQILTRTPFIGFAVLFGGAGAFRLLSMFFLSRMHEPPPAQREEKDRSLLRMAINMGSTNIGKFTLFVSLVNFMTNIASPFFSVYMLSDLKFSYVTYTIVISAVSVASLIFVYFWGQRADFAGNIRVIKVTSFLVPIVPLLWLPSHNPYYLIFAQIFSGFAWSGFMLATVNFVYDVSEARDRTRYIALYNTFTSLAVFFGALIGGYLVPILPALFGYRLLSLFTLSGILRLVVVIVFVRQMVEVRRVPSISISEFIAGRVNPSRLTRGNGSHYGNYR
jgi:MFS family permease